MLRSSHAQEVVLPVWRALRPDAESPAQVELLKQDSLGTAVYRLRGVGSGGRSIVAKRSHRTTASVERAVYEELLPRVPLPRPRYYGSVEEPDGGFMWLFVEDVGGRRYRAHDAAHRAAAAKWLGAMHVHSTGMAAADRLPRRETGHYLGLLRSSRTSIRSALCDADLVDDDRDMLTRAIGHCDELESRWAELDQACACLPGTLVHGDFVDNNVYLREEKSGVAVLAVDWEKAGWGVPAEDISSVDVSRYREVVRDRWPDLRQRELELAARTGRVFRCLVYLYWAVRRFPSDSIDRRIEDVRRCERWIGDFVRREIWRREPR